MEELMEERPLNASELGSLYFRPLTHEEKLAKQQLQLQRREEKRQPFPALQIALRITGVVALFLAATTTAMTIVKSDPTFTFSFSILAILAIFALLYAMRAAALYIRTTFHQYGKESTIFLWSYGVIFWLHFMPIVELFIVPHIIKNDSLFLLWFGANYLTALFFATYIFAGIFIGVRRK